MNFDIVIIGAGPTGLSFARALADSGLRVAIIERQSEAALENPAFDGREIALTHLSAKLMRELGLWDRINPEAISLLRDARVLNGSSLYAMNIDHHDGKQSELGYLVSNCIIRKAAYEAVKAANGITLFTDAQVTGINTGKEQALVTLANGETISTQLVVAADSRFSEARRAMGIATAMHDFGKTMMVCAMEHEIAHQHVAWEWFDYGQTLALLPMNGLKSSVVITMPAQQIQHMMAMSEVDFNREVEARFRHRLGKMKLVTTRHAYPLVTTYANNFVAPRFALMGDAAVGMHPVTAHGFNFGLRAADNLAREIKTAHNKHSDIAAASLLARYEQTHRRATRPLFLATHAIAKLYGNDSPPARLIRATTLRIGNRIAPFKRAVAGFLTEAH